MSQQQQLSRKEVQEILSRQIRWRFHDNFKKDSFEREWIHKENLPNYYVVDEVRTRHKIDNIEEFLLNNPGAVNITDCIDFSFSKFRWYIESELVYYKFVSRTKKGRTTSYHKIIRAVPNYDDLDKVDAHDAINYFAALFCNNFNYHNFTYLVSFTRIPAQYLKLNPISIMLVINFQNFITNGCKKYDDETMSENYKVDCTHKRKKEVPKMDESLQEALDYYKKRKASVLSHKASWEDYLDRVSKMSEEERQKNYLIPPRFRQSMLDAVEKLHPKVRFGIDTDKIEREIKEVKEYNRKLGEKCEECRRVRERMYYERLEDSYRFIFLILQVLYQNKRLSVIDFGKSNPLRNYFFRVVSEYEAYMPQVDRVIGCDAGRRSIKISEILNALCK